MLKRLAILLLLAVLAGPVLAEPPWTAADTLRSEAGRVERLFYRGASAARDAGIAGHLAAARTAWEQAAPGFGAAAAGIAPKVEDWAGAVAARDAAAAARARQVMWAALTAAGRDQALAALAAGDAQTAGNWLTLRDYARASGDTAATEAVQALAAGRLAPADARAAVEAELLTVAASELRLAIGRAQADAAAGHAIQYAGDLGRIEGLIGSLSANLSARLGPDALPALTAALARAGTDPAALAGLAERLAGYAPIALSPEEQLRRARLLRRFTGMVGKEYALGVHGGQVTVPTEYAEAQVFRDRAVSILADLGPQLADPAATARLAVLYDRMQAAITAKSDAVQPLVDETLALVDRTFGAEAASGGYQTAVDSLPLVLDELLVMARAGDWAGAEEKRLEAYSWYDPDIEGRLKPRAPTEALRLEARFWEGSARRPGLAALIAAKDAGALADEVAGVRSDLTRARASIEAQVSAPALVLQSAGILFREGLEAVLILAALLAALRAEGLAPARFRPALATGVTLALAGSFLLWGAARWLVSITTLAREALEGGTALLAAAVLVWIVVGLSAGGGHVAALRARLAGVANPWSVGVLAFLVVFREGFETVLFYEALLVDAAPLPVLAGLALGGGAALAAGWAVLASGRKLPLKLFFRVTTVLLAMLAVMLTGAGVRGLQTAALLPATPVGWFPDRDWLQLWLGLYPIAEPLALQAAVLAVILWSARPRRTDATARA